MGAYSVPPVNKRPWALIWCSKSCRIDAFHKTTKCDKATEIDSNMLEDEEKEQESEDAELVIDESDSLSLSDTETDTEEGL